MKDLQQVNPELLNALREEGFIPIGESVETTIERMRLIREGKLFPLYTSLEKEKSVIGGTWPGEMEVTAGRTGGGKTTKVLSDIGDYIDPDINPFYIGNLSILYYNWEIPGWRNVLKLISRSSERTVKELLDTKILEEEEKYEELKRLARRYSKTPIFFSPISTTVKAWYNNLRKLLLRTPDGHVHLVALDHTRLITRASESSEEALITALMKAAMLLKNEFPFKVIFHFISQLNRNIEQGLSDRSQIGNRLPIASDIFGSDAVIQCSDTVKILHRPGIYGLTKFNDIPTGRDPDNPDVEDTLLIECIIKQREGKLTNILLEHNLAINKIIDHVI